MAYMTPFKELRLWLMSSPSSRFEKSVLCEAALVWGLRISGFGGGLGTAAV